MSSRIALFLPASVSQSWCWVETRDGIIVARGEGMPDFAVEPETTLVAVAPADAVTLHWAELPSRSPAQAAAAARILVGEASVTPLADLHVAVGQEAGVAERPIGVVSNARMREWLAQLASVSADPVAIIPAPMLLPRPDQGYVIGDFGAGGRVVRGLSSGFADEEGLTGLITGDATVEILDREALEAATIAALADPPLDLRQGAFAQRQVFAIDWALVRRLAWLLVAIMSVTLLITLVQIMRYNSTADALEAKADMLARQGLPRGETVNDAGSQLTDRLTRIRGGGAGFSQTAAAIASAVSAVPGAEITGLTFDATGKLRVNVTTQTQGQIKDLQDRIVAAGFEAEPSVFSGSGNRFTGSFTVSVR
jgi:general secretion pathway protein L